MNERWVTFDCFGTLVDWQSGFRRILTPLAGERLEELVRAYHNAEAATQKSRPSGSYKEILATTLQRAAEAVHLPLGAGHANILVAGWPQLPIFPDTQPALEALRADGWRLGILTNCDDDLFEQTRLRFPVCIDTVVTAQQVKAYKPGLAHFEAFERRTGVERQHWIHVGVSWWHDMEPARKMGIKRVWIDRELSGHDATTVTARIPDLTRLHSIVKGFAVE